METLLIIFIAVTALAVVIQASVLVALYLSVKRTTDLVEKFAAQVQQRALPVIDSAGEMLLDLVPKIKTISSNIVDTTSTVKQQVERLDTTMTAIADRAQNQVNRADEFVSRTMDKVEGTTHILQKAVLSPVHQVAGIISGLTVGINSLFKKRRQPNGSMADEELFI